MVKCPRGSPSQVRANLAYISGPTVPTNGHDFAKGQMERESETLTGESEGSELDSIRADKRCPPTARDELVYFFTNSFLDILVDSWQGKPCVKQKLGPLSSRNDSEEYGEDLGPCDPSMASFTTEYLRDLYQKRSQMSKEKLRKESTVGGGNLEKALEKVKANGRKSVRATEIIKPSRKLKIPKRQKMKKKDSISTESEYLNEEDFEAPSSPDQWKTPVDEDVHFVLSNGVWYKGRVSRRLMEGEGYYFWEDGATFQGEFEGGCATGKGRLEFPDLSVYEGGVYKAFRHGDGMFCFSGSPVMYSGQWWLGKKHGYGLIVYSDPSESHNFYKGQWQDGVKEGFGFRQYPSGAKYVGFWSNGQRHGRGVMFWSNHDIYRGEWKEGLMHGYGEYTWNGFINKSLSYPAANTYRGFWEEGPDDVHACVKTQKRNGRGIFEMKSGPMIETIWEKNMKEGPGVVVCENGFVYSSEKLFHHDIPIMQLVYENKSDSPLEETNHKKPNRFEDSQFAQSSNSMKVISIPISSPVYNLNLHPHLQKLFSQLNNRNRNHKENLRLGTQMVTITPTASAEWTNQKQIDDLMEYHNFKTTQLLAREEVLLRNYITLKICSLRGLYNSYSKLPCDKPPPFPCVLLRLFLWQMLIDGGIPSSYFSLIDVDDLLVNEEYLLIQDPHDPFEQIQFWQFIHILIVLSWHLYGRHVYDELQLMEEERVTSFLRYYGSGEYKNVLKTAFKYFIEKHLLPVGQVEGSTLPSDRAHKFEESDFAPMEAIYIIYCNVGEPHSIRDFLSAICKTESEDDGPPNIVRYFEKLPFYKVEGKNAITIAGELQHIPGNGTFNIPEIFQLERQEAKREPKSELTCFNGLKARRVIRCLKEVCPEIMMDDCIVNMDYKLTFLEFYRAIILCTKLQLKMKAMNDMREDVIAEYKVQMEEYKKQLSEYEKQKENPVVSRKRSRQFSELSKKGRK